MTGQGDESPDPRTTLRLDSLFARARAAFRGPGQKAEVARGATWSAGLAGLGMALGFLSQLVLTRTLGEEGYGVYSYALGWITTMITLTTLDFGMAGVRFLGAYVGGQEWGRVRAFLTQITLLVVVGTAAIAIGMAAVLTLNRESLESGRLDAYLIACILFPVTALLSLIGYALQALKRVVMAQAPSLVIRPLVVVSALLLWGVVLTRPLTPAAAVAVNLGASVIATMIGLWGLYRALPPEVSLAAPVSEFWLWLKTTAGLFGITVSQTILSGKIDVVVVGTLLSPSSAGMYNLAILLSRFTRVGVEAVEFIATPMIAEVHHNQPKPALQRLVTHTVRLSAWVCIPLLAGVALAGHWILGFFFGPAFIDAYPILLVLALATFLGILFGGGTSGYVMSMTGHQNAAAWIVAVSAVVYVAAVVPLTNRYGAVGTATATLVAYSVRHLLLVWYIRTRLGINVLPIGGRHLAESDL